MDILSQYEKQSPAVSHEQPMYQLPSEYGFLIRLVMKISGGRIKDAIRANYILIGVAIVFLIIAGMIFLFARSGSNSRYAPVPVMSNVPDVDWPPRAIMRK